MRKVFAMLFVAVASVSVYAAQGGSAVVVDGPHICCKQCITVATKLLSGINGVSEVKAEKGKVSFAAKDEAAVKAGVEALYKGGFYGKATAGGKEVKVDVAAAPTGKADAVVVKDVHVCCGQSVGAVNKLFKDAKVSYEGKGPQKTVKVEGKDLDRGAVLESLRKGGFNGTVEK